MAEMNLIRAARGRLLDLAHDVFASVVRHGWPASDRNRSEVMNWNLLLHLLPVRVQRRSLKFSVTLGLGMISLFLFLILCATGVVLMFYYVPSTGEAYGRMKDLQFVVSYGRVLRNLHRWSAHAMVFMVFLHMCRVFYTASYKKPREFNWGIGVILLVITLGLSFTGYLLPWDQLAYWAITVGSSIAGYAPVLGPKVKYVLLGGNQVGQEALIRFYVLHCVALPLAAVALVSLHFWRVRKDGGLARPGENEPADSVNPEPFRDPDKTYGLMAVVRGNQITSAVRTPDDAVQSWPDLVYRLLVIGTLVLAVLFTASLLFNAPLKELANPQFPENPAKAPWYFLGLQEMVSYSALAGGVLIPTLVVLWLLAVPYLDREMEGQGQWLALPGNRAAAARTAAMALVAGIAVVGVAIYTGGVRGLWSHAPQPLLDLINPGTILALVTACFAAIEWRRSRSVRSVMIAAFTAFLVLTVILTVVGIYFRGPNWKFYWPWQHWSAH